MPVKLRRPSLSTALGVALLIGAAAIAIAALQIRSANRSPPDWTALCSPDPTASDRGARRIVLDENDRVGIAVRVPTTFVATEPGGIRASSAIYPVQLTLAFTLAEAGASDGPAFFAALTALPEIDAPWQRDGVAMTLARRPHGPTPGAYSHLPAAAPADAQSGLAVLRTMPPGREHHESHEFLARPDPAQRQAIHACRKNDTSRCHLYLDAIDGVYASLKYDRARLPQAPALEAATRTLLRCFLAGGRRP